MSFYEYNMGLRLDLLINNGRVPFNSIIQAAMRNADSDNLERLKQGFPEQWADLQARYNAPGGVLPGDGGKHDKKS